MRIRIQDPESFRPGIWAGKLQIWDKHPVSETLLLGHMYCTVYRPIKRTFNLA